MYIVTRRDLSVGMQLAQTAHVAMAWRDEWDIDDDTVIVLTVENELALHGVLLDMLEHDGFAGASWFREPDLEGALTAVAFTASTKKLLRNLPLAGK